MIPAPFPPDEWLRVQQLLDYGVLDTPPEAAFDDLARLAALACQTPIALVSLVDSTRQWFKASIGLEASETPREISFCGHAILQSELMIVPDAAADERFADNPLVTGAPHIRFYAGMPLKAEGGARLGTLCVIDREPRTITVAQEEQLALLARQVVSQLDMLRMVKRLRDATDEVAFLRQGIEQTQDPMYWLSPAQGFRFVFVNEAAARHYGYPKRELLTMRVPDWNPEITPERLVANWEVIKREGAFTFETQHRLRDGRVVSVEVTANYVAAGGQEYIAGIIRNITERKRIEQALQAKDRHLETAQAIAHVGSWRWDIRTGEEVWSDEFFRIFGHEPGAIPPTYEAFLGALHSDDKPRVLAAVAATLEEDRPYEIEFRIIRPDGTVRIIEGRGLVERDEQGVPLYMDGTVLDVTAARQAEQERDVLLYAIDHSLEGLALLDDEGRYTYMNPAHAAMYGYTVDQLLGQSWRGLYTADAGTVIEQTVFPVLTRTGNWIGELVGRRATGELFEVEVALQVLEQSASGIPHVLACTCRDVTVRKRAAATQRLLAAIVESSEDAIISKTPDGFVTSWNRGAERLFGYRADEMVGRSITRLLPPNRLDEEAEILQRMAQGETVEHFETARLRKDGQSVPVSLTLSPLRDANGRVIGIAKIARDITRLVQVGAQLRQANDLLERRVEERTAELTQAHTRLTGLSRRLVQAQEAERARLSRDLHDEIGQALTALNLNLQVLRGERGRPLSSRITDSLELTEGLLQRVRSMAVDLRPQLLDEVGLERALRLYANRQAERYGWSLSFVLEGDDRVLADDVAVTCYRVVQEALTNTARHAQATSVLVHIRIDEQAIAVSVRDNGIGFDPRVPMGEVNAGKGVGLAGLSERVRLAGGRLTVASAPQAGSTVEVRLPRDEGFLASWAGEFPS